uniref:Uncharacterized protein n=1 Tax=Cacopsylla melanoneura TaxID=428564 RepID=A0A8D8WW63_9HEMI
MMMKGLMVFLTLVKNQNQLTKHKRKNQKCPSKSIRCGLKSKWVRAILEIHMNESKLKRKSKRRKLAKDGTMKLLMRRFASQFFISNTKKLAKHSGKRTSMKDCNKN